MTTHKLVLSVFQSLDRGSRSHVSSFSMMKRLGWVFAAILCLSAAGCSSSGFGDSKVKELLETKALQLDAEQVSLTMGQVDCGVKADLFEPPVPGSGETQIARLTAKGRAIKFTDDVTIGSSVFGRPFAQVRGDFSLAVQDVVSIKD